MKEGSHGKSHCEALRAGPVQVLLTEGKLPNKDKDIVLEYSYHDGITPEGVVFTKRWKLPTKK